jgi:hypothetical protein
MIPTRGIAARNGFRSYGEFLIAETLVHYKIPFQYEPDLFLKDQNKYVIWHPDFYLPKYNTIIEYFGMKGDKNYDTGIRKKKRLYYENHLNLIPVYPATLKKDYKAYILHGIQAHLKRLDRDLESRIYHREKTPYI